jgi:hypothetical protein
MVFVVVSIYIGAIASFVGKRHGSQQLGPKALSAQKPERPAYIVAGTALLVSTGIGVVVASHIVVGLGYMG